MSLGHSRTCRRATGHGNGTKSWIWSLAARVALAAFCEACGPLFTKVRSCGDHLNMAAIKKLRNIQIKNNEMLDISLKISGAALNGGRRRETAGSREKLREVARSEKRREAARNCGKRRPMAGGGEKRGKIAGRERITVRLDLG